MVVLEIPTVAFYLLAFALITVLVFLCVLLYYVIKVLSRVAQITDDVGYRYRRLMNRVQQARDWFWVMRRFYK
jgi:hypothetical protein